MTVLVTGGAGYIGAHVVRALRRRGEDVQVVDDLRTGDAARIPDVPIERLDLAAADSEERLVALIRRRRVSAVLHLAAVKRVDESVERPLHYHRQNVAGLLHVVRAMELAGAGELVFASSAAVYGGDSARSLLESDPTAPTNPYGTSKLMGEWIVDAARREGAVRGCSLRFFNVAGAESPRLAEPSATNLLPIVIRRLRAGLRPQVFGVDHPTPDGTCIRDYVHVADVAEAHLAALDALRSNRCGPVYNIGTGTGTSVRAVVRAAAERAGLPATTEDLPARAGDPAVAVADPGLIARDLGWRSSRSFEDVVASALDTAP